MSEHNRYSLERILRCRDGSNRARPRESDTSDSLTYARACAPARAQDSTLATFEPKGAPARNRARAGGSQAAGRLARPRRTYFFLAVAFSAVVFFAAVFFAGAFLAVVFFAPDLVAALAIHPLPLRA